MNVDRDCRTYKLGIFRVYNYDAKPLAYGILVMN